MKLITAIVNIIVLGSILSSCTKNEAVLDINVTVNRNDIFAGQEAIFNISGQAEFVAFYSGADSASSYSNYPLCSGLPVNIGEVKKKYNTQGTYTATITVASYGDWGQEAQTQQFDFEINVVDNRTGIKSFKVKSGGLLGKEYTGVINDDNSTITVQTDSGTRITKMTTTLITESNDAIVELDGEEFVNKSKVDYSLGDVIYTIEAPDGTKRDWTVTVLN